MHLNHALEIKDVCQEDSGLYTLVLKNNAAGLERKLNITLVVNGVCMLLCGLEITQNILGTNTKQQFTAIKIYSFSK